MMAWKKNKPSSLLSMEWGYAQLHFEWVKKNGGKPHCMARGSVALPENPFQEPPEIIARAIRQALDQAQVTEKHCIVSLPVGWLFSCRTELPELEQEDLQSFLDTQAEREFPLPLDGLQIAQAPFQDHLEASHRFMMALPTQRFDLLNEVMERAGLKPLSWSVAQAGPSFLQSLGVQDALCLLSTPMGYDLLAVSGGALVMGRSLSESNQPQQLAREIKISLGELSVEMQRSIRTCLIPLQASQEGVAQEALVQLQERMGMSHRILSGEPSLAYCLACDFLVGPANPIEFLPPQVSTLETWSRKFDSGRHKWVGGSLAAAILLISLIFFWQGQTLEALEDQWAVMEEPVKELETLQQRIRLYRSWYDQSIPTLQLIEHLTEAFPEEGEVWVKELDIRENGQVSCSGFATSNRAWLDMLEKLRGSSQVKDLTVDQVRDDRQTQFSFRYRWEASQP